MHITLMLMPKSEGADQLIESVDVNSYVGAQSYLEMIDCGWDSSTCRIMGDILKNDVNRRVDLTYTN